MKYLILIGSLCCFLNTANCQVVSEKKIAALPEVSEKLWILKAIPNFTIGRDSAVSHNGSPSVKITGSADDDTFQPFSQVIPINIDHFTMIAASAYIKPGEGQAQAHMWCQVWDTDRKQIGFASTVMPGTTITEEDGWKKYTMVFNVSPEAHYLLLGGYLQGKGTSWFGNFKLDALPPSAEPASKEVLTFIHHFTKIVKEHSIFTDSLNWPVIEDNIDQMAHGLKTVDEASILTRYVMDKLRRAGDIHSFIQPKALARQYATKNTNPEQPTGKLLESGIGYIAIPGFGSTNDTAMLSFVKKIQGLIKETDGNTGVQNWIVDLRNDTGGNMWPMLKGLEPIIPSGPLGYFVKVDRGKETRHEWKNYIKYSDSYTLKKPVSKVAVLIGPRTGSSGEMTAVAFAGKPNTRLFGQQSAGYITANSSFPLSDGSMLLLAISHIADGNGKKYLTKITPDVVIENVMGEDAPLRAAEAWLLNK